MVGETHLDRDVGERRGSPGDETAGAFDAEPAEQGTDRALTKAAPRACQVHRVNAEAGGEIGDGELPGEFLTQQLFELGKPGGRDRVTPLTANRRELSQDLEQQRLDDEIVGSERPNHLIVDSPGQPGERAPALRDERDGKDAILEAREQGFTDVHVQASSWDWAEDNGVVFSGRMEGDTTCRMADRPSSMDLLEAAGEHQ